MGQVKDEQRLHSIEGETLPGFGEGDVGKSARLTPNFAGALIGRQAGCVGGGGHRVLLPPPVIVIQ